MGLDNPCCVGTYSLHLQPRGQYSLDRLIISKRSLLKTKEEEKEMIWVALRLQHLVGKSGGRGGGGRNTWLILTQRWVQILTASWLRTTAFSMDFFFFFSTFYFPHHHLPPQCPLSPWILRMLRYWSPWLWTRHGQLSGSSWKSPRMPYKYILCALMWKGLEALS